MLVLSYLNCENMTDEQLLLMCVKEYADENNYIPYEKEYSEGQFTEIIPSICRNRSQFANQVLAFIAERKAKQLEDEIPF